MMHAMPLGRHGTRVAELTDVILAAGALPGSLSQVSGRGWQVIEQRVYKAVTALLSKRRLRVVTNDGVPFGPLRGVAPAERWGCVGTLTGMLGRNGTMGLEGRALQLHGGKGKGHVRTPSVAKRSACPARRSSLATESQKAVKLPNLKRLRVG